MKPITARCKQNESPLNTKSDATVNYHIALKM